MNWFDLNDVQNRIRTKSIHYDLTSINNRLNLSKVGSLDERINTLPLSHVMVNSKTNVLIFLYMSQKRDAWTGGVTSILDLANPPSWFGGKLLMTVGPPRVMGNILDRFQLGSDLIPPWALSRKIRRKHILEIAVKIFGAEFRSLHRKLTRRLNCTV